MQVRGEGMDGEALSVGLAQVPMVGWGPPASAGGAAEGRPR